MARLRQRRLARDRAPRRRRRCGARRERRQRPAPAVLAEVGDHDHEAGAARHAARLDQRAGERVGGDALAAPCSASGATPSASARSIMTCAWRPPRGGSSRPSGAPARSSAARPPLRVASLATAAATPMATSAFRRCSVPNAIEGDTSSTSQVVSARSGTCSRTCGMPVRAVDGGVELTHVVADLVRPQLHQLGAGARARRQMVARHQAAGAAHEREVERAQQRAGHRPGALAARGRAAPQRDVREANSQGQLLPRSRRHGLPQRRSAGSSTAASTRSSSASGDTPSLSAS